MPATVAVVATDADTVSTLITGLLVAFGAQRRPISAVMLRNEDEVTTLLGRAAAYCQASATYPE